MKLRSKVILGLLGIGLICVGSKFPDWFVERSYQPQIPFLKEKWLSPPPSNGKATVRQLMVGSLLSDVLPGKTKEEIEGILGASSTHAGMRRYTADDLKVRERDASGNWKPFPRTGKGYYFDEFEWDLIYPLGKEQIFIFDHKGQEFSPDTEYLLIRLDETQRFGNWQIIGSDKWNGIIPPDALKTCRIVRPKSSSSN